MELEKEPTCYPWPVPEDVRQAMIEELRTWDRRFDGPETIVDSILALLRERLLVHEGRT